MAGLFDKKRQKRQQLLDKQLLTKRKKSLHVILKKIPHLLLLFIGILSLQQAYVHFYWPQFSFSSRISSVHIMSSPLQLQDKSIQLKKFIKKRLRQNKSIQQISYEAKSKFDLYAIQLFQQDLDNLAVHIQPLQAKAILGQNEQFISKSGRVFGSTKVTKKANLPVILGIKKSQTSEVQEALRLLEELDKSSIQTKSINYTPYVGFFVEDKSLPFTIGFGQKPFTKKIKHLFALLATLKNKENIVRIDLNYQGKAFIKRLEI